MAYYNALQDAAWPRHSDTDGRGPLTEYGLQKAIRELLRQVGAGIDDFDDYAGAA